MMRRWRDFAVNLGLVFASILLFLGFCELVVFRLVWLASDAPVSASPRGSRFAADERMLAQC